MNLKDDTKFIILFKIQTEDDTRNISPFQIIDKKNLGTLKDIFIDF